MYRVLNVADPGIILDAFDEETWEMHPVHVESGQMVIYFGNANVVCEEEDWGQFSKEDGIRFLRSKGVVHREYSDKERRWVPTGKEIGVDGMYGPR